MDLLIRKGADVQAIDIKGCTPLHYAAVQGKLQMEKNLISKDFRGLSKAKEICLFRSFEGCRAASLLWGQYKFTKHSETQATRTCHWKR